MRPVLAVVLAGVVLLGAAVAFGPHVPPARKGADQPAPSALEAYVARTTEHLDRVPGDWTAWAQLGMAYVQLARATSNPASYPAAEAALRRSLAVRPNDNAAAETGLGALAAARHDFAGALVHARRAVAADAYSADGYGVLTDALIELGRYAEAVIAVRRMLSLRPDTGSYGRASYSAELHGDVDRATAQMRRALAVAADRDDAAFALTQLGELAFGTGDLDTAAARFAEGIARKPGDPALLAGRAKVFAARGDLPAAIADLRAATGTLPTVEHAAALADTLTAAGDTAGAGRAEDLARIGARLQSGPSSTTDIDLIVFQADHGEAATAVAKGRALFTKRPGVPVEMAYAWALHAAGRDREALDHADRGLRLGTRDARWHYWRGMIRLAVADRPGARRDLTEALRISPHFSLRYGPTARAALAKLGGAA
jgi:tetratricopeptide (TPR) repeat protein